MSEINNTEEITEGDFPLDLKLIGQHQWKYPSLLAKYKEDKYQKGSCRGGSYIYLNFITWKIRFLFHQYSKVMYYIGTIRIYFIQEWMQRRQLFSNFCTGLA